MGSDEAFTLRPFRKDDLAEAFALDQRCFPPGIAYTKAEFRYFLSRPSAYALVVERAGRMAGFLIAAVSGRGVRAAAHVITIDVDPALRRTGIATLLMDAMEAFYHAAGLTTVVLEVAVDNAGAQSFYQARGYAQTGREQDYYGDGLDALRMQKSLRPSYA